MADGKARRKAGRENAMSSEGNNGCYDLAGALLGAGFL
jgi:hypothetical protein